jgi:rRNA maturation protein Nop10
MCECLVYADGDAYLCVPCSDMVRECPRCGRAVLGSNPKPYDDPLQFIGDRPEEKRRVALASQILHDYDRIEPGEAATLAAWMVRLEYEAFQWGKLQDSAVVDRMLRTVKDQRPLGQD